MMEERMENIGAENEVNGTDMAPETSGKGKLGKIILGVAGLAAGVGVLAWKKLSKKSEESSANRLRKKGYAVYKVEPNEPDEPIDVDSEEIPE